MEADVLFLHSIPFLLLFFIKIPHWDMMKVKPNSLCIRASTFFKLQERDEFPLLFHLDMYFALITIPAWSHFAEEIVLKKNPSEKAGRKNSSENKQKNGPLSFGMHLITSYVVWLIYDFTTEGCSEEFWTKTKWLFCGKSSSTRLIMT